MSRDHNDIYSIVERLRILEEGLDKNQRSVNQLGATFRPKTVAVLTAKTDPKNPLAGKLVGGSESVERDEAVLEADMAEDVLDKVKKSFTDFIKSVEDTIEDSDIKEKKKGDSDLKAKDKKDRDLVTKEAIPDSLEEDPTQDEPQTPAPVGPGYPVTPESAAVKTVALNSDVICEIHGNEHDGFEIRRGARSLPTRFKNISQAEMALEMYLARLKKQNEAQDYLDEE
jgi:hypothetical protein